MRRLIVLTGAVGVGKTTLARELARRTPFVVVSNDQIRRELVAAPTFSAAELRLVHDEAQRRVGAALAEGADVVHDGTNLTEAHRRAIAGAAADPAGVMTVVVQASSDVVACRLLERDRVARRADGRSWLDVHRELAAAQTTPAERHIVVDCSEAPATAAAAVERALRVTAP